MSGKLLTDHTLLMIAIVLAFPSVAKTAVFDLTHSVKSMLFLPSFHPNVGNRIWPILVQGWTLNYEMFFYLLFGLLLLIKSIELRLTGLIMLLVSLVLLGVSYEFASPYLKVYTDFLLLEFGFGCLIGYLFVNEKFGYWSQYCLILGLAGFISSILYPSLLDVRTIEWGIPSALVVIGSLAVGSKRELKKISFFRMLGDSSYSLYLVHTFVLGVIGYIWSKFTSASTSIDLFMIFACLSLCIFAGWFSYRFIERPIGLFLRRRST